MEQLNEDLFEPTPIHEMHDLLPLYRAATCSRYSHAASANAIDTTTSATAPSSTSPFVPQAYPSGGNPHPDSIYAHPRHLNQLAPAPSGFEVATHLPALDCFSNLVGQRPDEFSWYQDRYHPVRSAARSADFEDHNTWYSESGSSSSEASLDQKEAPLLPQSQSPLKSLAHPRHHSNGAIDNEPEASISGTKSKKKRRKSDDPDAILPALSQYNFFFRAERERLIDQAAATHNTNSLFDLPNDWGECDWSEERKNSILHKHWYRDRSVRRKHRKTNGQFDFTAYVIVRECVPPCR